MYINQPLRIYDLNKMEGYQGERRNVCQCRVETGE